ncbi:hypothetical protein BJ165DRAFT_1487254, partial [Panaeolus papilionaceus]
VIPFPYLVLTLRSSHAFTLTCIPLPNVSAHRPPILSNSVIKVVVLPLHMRTML